MLGPLEIDGETTSLSPRDRRALTALAVHPGEVMTSDRLADALWGDEPPASWSKVVHGCVMRLRRSVGRDAIETAGGGYRLTLVSDEFDTRCFETMIGRGRELAATGEPDRAASALLRALALWRGSPFEDLDGWSPGRTEAARLEELRRSAEEDLLEARLAGGEHREVAVEAEALVARGALAGAAVGPLALAQYRCGRQADALRSLQWARRTLVDQLGIDPGADLVALEASILRQDPELASRPQPPAISQRCPYPGLLPYDVADTERFFGRDAEIAACLRRLAASPLLVVAGPSGCGKSSLVRAGLVPALQREGHAVVTFAPGAEPDDALTSALASAARTPVVVVDQLEEVFTLHDDPGVARAFLARLAVHAAERAPVVVTVRADHLVGIGADPGFAHLAEQGLHLVSPLAGDALRAAIEGPAAQAGLRLEPGLVDLLVRDSEGEPGALPLLSYALAQTWERRDGRVLTVGGYRATGGIRGAVARVGRPPLREPAGRAARRAALGAAAPGHAVRRRRARPLPRPARHPRRRRRARTRPRPARARPAGHRGGGHRRGRARGAGPGLAPAAVLARRGRGGPAHLPPPLRRPPPAGSRSAGPTASSTAAPASRPRSSGATGRAPDLTSVEGAFLESSVARAASEHAALVHRTRHQARQNRRLRGLFAATAVLLVVALVAGLVAVQRGRATGRQRDAAALEALVNQSLALRQSDRATAALLAVEAYRRDPDDAGVRSALLGTFTAAPDFVGYHHLPAEQFVTGAVVPGTTGALVALDGRELRRLDLETGELGPRFRPVVPALNRSSVQQPAVLRVSADGRRVVQMTTTRSSAACVDPQAPRGVRRPALRRLLRVRRRDAAAGWSGRWRRRSARATPPSAPTARSWPSPAATTASWPSTAPPMAGCSARCQVCPAPTRSRTTPTSTAPPPRSPSEPTGPSTSARCSGPSGWWTPPRSRSCARSTRRCSRRTSTSWSRPTGCSSAAAACTSPPSTWRPEPCAGRRTTPSARISGPARAPRSRSRRRPAGCTARTARRDRRTRPGDGRAHRRRASPRSCGWIGERRRHRRRPGARRVRGAAGGLPLAARRRWRGRRPRAPRPDGPRLRPDRHEAPARPRPGGVGTRVRLDDRRARRCACAAVWFGRDLLGAVFADGTGLYDVAAHAPPPRTGAPAPAGERAVRERRRHPDVLRRGEHRPAHGCPLRAPHLRSDPAPAGRADHRDRRRPRRGLPCTGTRVGHRRSAPGRGHHRPAERGNYGDRTTTVYDGRTGERIAGPVRGAVVSEVSPDGVLVGVSGSGAITQYDLDTLRPIGTFPSMRAFVLQLGFSADGETLVVGAR